jgi:hypothetical protein
MVFMRLWIVAGCLLLLASQALGDEPAGTAAQKGRAFLVGLLDADLGLLPEYAGARTYWLYHDNYLARKVLAGTHPRQQPVFEPPSTARRSSTQSRQ